MLKITPLAEDDGYEVRVDGVWKGYVYPDAFGGWRPCGEHGRWHTIGRPGHRTLQGAAHWFLEPV